MKRQHPIAMLRYTSKNFWLLLIPLVRGLLALGFDFYSWLSGAYLDILVLLIFFGAAFFRWWNVTYKTEDNGIRFSDGLFVNRGFFIPFSAMTSVSARKNFFFRPLKAVTVYIDTDSGPALKRSSEPDIKLIIKLTDYKELCKKMPDKASAAKLTYRSPKGKLLLFSLLFSSALSSLIYFGTLLIQGGRLIDRELEERFITAVNDVTKFAERIINGITPVTVAIIIIIAGGWLYSFVSNYLRHINFRIQRWGENIFVENGFFTKWRYRFNAGKINYADLRQNLLMKICGVMSVHVSCTGYGKQKNEIPVFVPITDSKSVTGVMKMFLPEFALDETEINPRWNYILRFIGPPTVLIFAIIAAAFFIVMLAPDWYSVILFLAVMGEIISVYLLVVKLAAFYTNGIGIGKSSAALRYCRYFQFHYIIVPKEKITGIEIRQTPFQKLNDSCDLILHARSEAVSSHRVRGLNLKDAEKMAERLGYNVNCT